MKILIFILLLGSCLNAYSATDKALHVGASFVIGSLAQYYTESITTSLIACMTVGVAKEVYDKHSHHGVADKNDLYFNAAGCLLGVTGVKAFQVYKKSDRYMLNYHYSFK